MLALSVTSKPAFRHSARNASARGVARAVAFAERHRHERAGLPDHAGLRDRGADRDRAGHDMRGAQDRHQPVAGVDAVLQRNDAGAGADQRFDLLARAFDVPQLDAEQHDIDRPDRRPDRRSPEPGRSASRRGRPRRAARVRCIAARCAPRATNVTSAPALASAAPKPPPTPPAPITAIRMSGLLFARSLTRWRAAAKRVRTWRKWIASWSAPAWSVWRSRARWRRTGREVIILEAAEGIGTETSSRNSEVIHAGIYYPANSLMARFCVEGRRKLYPYCAEHGVPHRNCGKLIVATNAQEDAMLAGIKQRAEANGVEGMRVLTRDEARRDGAGAELHQRAAVADDRHHRQPRLHAGVAGRRRARRRDAGFLQSGAGRARARPARSTSMSAAPIR